jgi:hypothetical protein
MVNHSALPVRLELRALHWVLATLQFAPIVQLENFQLLKRLHRVPNALQGRFNRALGHYPVPRAYLALTILD